MTLHEAGLNIKPVAHLLGVLVNDTHRGDGVFLGNRQGRGAIEDTVQLTHTNLVDGAADQGILHDRILHPIFAQLMPQGGILSHGDALIVHEHTGAGALQGVHQRRDNGLLFTENLCVRHLFSPPGYGWAVPHPADASAKKNTAFVPRRKQRKTTVLAAFSAGYLWLLAPCCL